MLGLIGGALQGGAQAANEMATNTLQERREKALMKIRQDFQVSEREAGQEFQLTRDETQQGYASDNAQLQHEMSMAQERYRQGQQNARTALTSRAKPQWQVLPDGEGGFVQYDPVSNTTRATPDGVNFGGNSGLSDVQERELDFVESEIAAMRESMSDDMGVTRQPTPEESAYMRDLTQQRQQILYSNQSGGQGGNDGPTILERLMQGEGKAQGGDQPEPSAPPPRPGQAGQPAPTGGSSSADSYVSRREQQDANQKADKAADDQVQSLVSDARRVLGRATIPNNSAEPFQRGGLVGREMGSGIDTEAETEKAREMLQQVKEAYNAESDPQRKAMLQKALDDYYEAGITE